ncbi:DNA excision repair protein ERCC-6-like [Phycodurus eques]|uniref:DNA excision repair protein ERCC-6-like n=1 Tax=Phycodurus eques TaxID=693459 RepID=UPI002ACE9EF0|nr:DNA excision repair protein ERCC-6-like [Phycodurus eques]
MNGHHPDGDVRELGDRLEKCLSVGDDANMEVYHRHIRDGKDAVRRGDMSKALDLFKMAYNIHRSDKLQKRIGKIEEFLAQNLEDDNDDEFVDINKSGLKLYKELYDKLYDYQRDGVAFLYGLYRDGRKGGILADDMGLGKTIQVISFLSGMYDSELVEHTMLVMPTSLITNWTKEFAKWTPGMRVKEFHGTSKAERTKNLEKVQSRSGVIITTYTMLMNNWQQLSSYKGREFKWDYMILDEAHKIKTSTTKTAKSASAIPSKNRVLLTGTPVQNNLREMWALFNFACQGTLLGTAKTFKMQYENPITRAREKDATPGEKALGSRMSENLMAIIQPYFLRRTKAEVQKNKDDMRYAGQAENAEEEAEVQKHSGATMPTLTRKNDLIVWTYLSGIQEDIYWKFISLEHIKELLMTSRSPLAELTILKKLCDHPRLLSARATATLGLKEARQSNDDDEIDGQSIADVPDETLIAESGKLAFLVTLLKRLRDEGHRTLVFAHYRMVLDILQRVLRNQGFKVLRLDGTISQVAERERLITLFQTDHSYSVFLLTTQVGGVGITLTAADRVVIYDPSWNPATDAQAVDRAYRIGQTRNVVIYRLITCGTVEEKIYRRQVFKDSLIRQTTGDKKNPFRYFSKQELRELFSLEDTRSSTTQLLLQSLHSKHRSTDTDLDMHLAHLHTMGMFGISHHDLMFSLNVEHDEAPQDRDERQYIEGRVQKAQELVKAESDLQMQFAINLESSTEPAWRRKSASERVEQSQEKKLSKPRSTLASPRHSNTSPAQVDLDRSSDSKEGGLKGQNSLIDLTGDESLPLENQEIFLEHSQTSLKQEKSQFQEGEGKESVQARSGADNGEVDDSFEEVKKVLPDASTYISEDEDLDLKYDDSNLDGSPMKPLQNKRLSVLQSSMSSLKVESLCRVSGSDSELMEGNFNLQLEESEISYQDGEKKLQSQLQLEEEDVLYQDEDRKLLSPIPLHEECDVLYQDDDDDEEKLLSHLQISGTFDVRKSLTERQLGLSIKSHVSEMDESIVAGTKKKKKTARIVYDSSEEVEEEEVEDEAELRPQSTKAAFNNFPPHGSSTPKCSPLIGPRRSVAGNTSVASRRSLVPSILQDLDHENEDISTRSSDEGEEEDVTAQTEDHSGETLNSDDEEVEEEEEVEEVEEEVVDPRSSNMEESVSEPELVSSERFEQCASNSAAKSAAASVDSYESLVTQGRESFNRGRLGEALDFFLKALDIKPGDPEVQFLTIQLYRQLSGK